MATGTLYSALRRMPEDHWIERIEDDALGNGSDSRERKLYRLSDLGRSILDLETGRLKSLVQLTTLRKVTD